MNKPISLFISLVFLILNTCCWAQYPGKSLFPNKSSEAFFKQAQDFQTAGKLDSALKYFNKADRVAPNTAVILHERGLLKSSMGKNESAIADLTKSIELSSDPELREIRLANRGIIYMHMQKMKLACEDWRKAGKSGEPLLQQYCK
jgi:tetratricopeptide (TPR) repeat protein